MRAERMRGSGGVTQCQMAGCGETGAGWTQEMGGSDTGGRTVGGVSSVLTCAPLVHEQCNCSVQNNKMRYLVDIA